MNLSNKIKDFRDGVCANLRGIRIEKGPFINAEEYTVEPFDRKISKDKKKSVKAARVEKAEKKSAKTEKKETAEE